MTVAYRRVFSDLIEILCCGFKLKDIGLIDLAAGLSYRTPSSHEDARSYSVQSNLQSAVIPAALPMWLHFGLPVMSHGTEQVG